MYLPIIGIAVVSLVAAVARSWSWAWLTTTLAMLPCVVAAWAINGGSLPASLVDPAVYLTSGVLLTSLLIRRRDQSQ
jgi:hypothetical protein